MKSFLKKLFALFLASCLIICTIVAIRTMTFRVRTDIMAPCNPSESTYIRVTPVLEHRLRQAFRFQTVSQEPGNYNRSELIKFREYLQNVFPVVHTSTLVQFDIINNYSLLYTVRGVDGSLTPYMLAAHLDVVPASEDGWEVPPFDGAMKDGYMYGRGAVDCKHMVMGILEALEYSLSTGFVPHRTLYIGFGHDEEVGGYDGAKHISDHLHSVGVTELEFLLDEGMTVVDAIIPGIQGPVALIGTSEKGQVILELKVRVPPGHSSMPPPESSIGILSKAIARIEANPQPSMFGYGPESALFEHIAELMDFPFKVLMSNLWLFGPLVSAFVSRKPTGNSIVRTVTSVTMFNAGIKFNVLAPEAVAIVNHRIHPAQTVQEVVDYDRYVINDERVQITIKSSFEPFPMSPYDDESFGYQMIKNSVRQVFGNLPVAPSLLIANTDTRHYLRYTKNVYRFSPTYNYMEKDISRFHGLNERISVRNYEQAVNFYFHIIQNCDKPGLESMRKHSEEL